MVGSYAFSVLLTSFKVVGGRFKRNPTLIPKSDIAVLKVFYIAMCLNLIA